MADVLSLLREYIINKRDIIEFDGQIIFGEYAWPKTVNTNYVIWGTGKNDVPKEYYTLETIMFLLTNDTISHPAYLRKALAERVPCVRRANRKDLLKYLKGITTTSSKIDKNAHYEIPTKIKRLSAESIEIVFKKPRLNDELLAAEFTPSKETIVSVANKKHPGLKILMTYLKSVEDGSSNDGRSTLLQIPINVRPNPPESIENIFKKPKLHKHQATKLNAPKESTITSNIKKAAEEVQNLNGPTNVNVSI